MTREGKKAETCGKTSYSAAVYITVLFTVMMLLIVMSYFIELRNSKVYEAADDGLLGYSYQRELRE